MDITTINLITIALDVFGLLLLILIAEGKWELTKNRTPKAKAFWMLWGVTFLSIAVDCVTSLPADWTGKSTLFSVILLIDFLVPFAVTALFALYIHRYLSEHVPTRFWPFGIVMCLCGMGVVATIGLFCRGTLFSIAKGNYEPGPAHSSYIYCGIIDSVVMITIVLLNARRTGLSVLGSMLEYMVFPCAAVILNYLLPECSFTIPSLSLSMLAIANTLTNDHEQLMLANEASSRRLAHIDELTGLQNRLAYTERTDSMGSDLPVGVLFADLNCLKYTNDRFGHRAGDRLLCEFAGILLSCFAKEDAFRISGDEFVVIACGLPEEDFGRRVHDLELLINSHEVPSASVGTAYGTQAQITELIDRAEQCMYTQKDAFHERYPQYSRGGSSAAQEEKA